MTLRCVLDGLLLDGRLEGEASSVVAYDGEEPFELEAVEALYYEVVTATAEELMSLERAHYRLLRRALDFRVSAV